MSFWQDRRQCEIEKGDAGLKGFSDRRTAPPKRKLGRATLQGKMKVIVWATPPSNEKEKGLHLCDNCSASKDWESQWTTGLGVWRF